MDIINQLRTLLNSSPSENVTPPATVADKQLVPTS